MVTWVEFHIYIYIYIYGKGWSCLWKGNGLKGERLGKEKEVQNNLKEADSQRIEKCCA